MEEGDLVLVNYIYRPVGSQSARTAYLNASATLANRTFSLTGGIRQQGGDPLAASGALEDVGLSEKWVDVGVESPATFLGRVRVSLDHRVRDFSTVRFRSTDADALWMLPFAGRFRMQIRGGVGQAEDDRTQVRSNSLSGDFNWRFSRTIRFDGSVSQYVWSRSGALDERFLNVRSSGVWDWGLFSTRLSVLQSQRRNGTHITSRRWELSVTRIF